MRSFRNGYRSRSPPSSAVPLRKHFLLYLALSLVSLSPAVWAGERCYGIILSTDGGSVSNATTGYGTAGCAEPCDCAKAFNLPAGAKITLQSDQAAIVATDRHVDAGNGLALTAGQILPTSTSAVPTTIDLPDGGKYAGGVVSVTAAPGSSLVRMRVFVRNGNE